MSTGHLMSSRVLQESTERLASCLTVAAVVCQYDLASSL